MLTITHAAATSFRPDERAPLRVVVADDHALYRRGIVRALERDPMLRVVAEASDGAAAAALILALEPDVAVLDVRMPELDGLTLCAELKRTAAELPTRCLVLTAFDDGEMPLQAMAAGADGFIGKDATHEEIAAAVLRVGDDGSSFEDLA